MGQSPLFGAAKVKYFSNRARGDLFFFKGGEMGGNELHKLKSLVNYAFEYFLKNHCFR